MKTKERTPAQVAENVYKSIVKDVAKLRREKSHEAAQESIQEDALSVEVTRTYTILLACGGPACRIIGELSEYGEPETARIEGQDWFTPWTEFTGADESVLLDYARCFYYGE